VGRPNPMAVQPGPDRRFARELNLVSSSMKYGSALLAVDARPGPEQRRTSGLHGRNLPGFQRAAHRDGQRHARKR
jgi:hypothetical protein